MGKGEMIFNGLPYAMLVGAFFFCAVYLMLSTSLIRVVIGVNILGNAVNLAIFVAGRVNSVNPTIIAPDELFPVNEIANPLPQALILTAIVIGFSMFTFILVLIYRAYVTLKTDKTDSYAPRPALPPLDY